MHSLPPSLQDTIISRCLTQITERPKHSQRLFHGRGHQIEDASFLSIDKYGETLWIRSYDPVDTHDIQQLAEALRDTFSALPTPCVLQNGLLQMRGEQGTPTHLLFGQFPERPVAIEDSLGFHIQFGRSQNIGLFLDMEYGRSWLKARAKGKRVLNLFSYTCAFSVVAHAAEATSIVNIDMNKNVLQTGRRNHQHNAQSLDNVTFLQHNIFKSWSKLRKYGPFDIIIIDPPTRQRGSFVAEKDYVRVVRRLPSLAAEQCDVLACLNATHLGTSFIESCFQEGCPEWRAVSCLLPPPPFEDIDPEKGLKIMHYTKP